MKTKTKQVLSILWFATMILFNGLHSLAQHSTTNWSFVLDGYNDVYLADILVDSSGNTYAAINYTSNLTIPILNQNLPFAPHVHGLILKLDANGKPIWAQTFRSDFDNRIRDIALAPNGDLLVTGFGDGQMLFPGKKDVLKVGKASTGTSYVIRSQGFYAARYTPNGDRKWVKYWNSSWGEGLSIAVNQQNEVFMSYYHYGIVTDKDSLIDSFVRKPGEEAKVGIAKFDSLGNLLSIKNLGIEKNASYPIQHNLKFDSADNLLLFGTFRGCILLSESDSLTNDNYYESLDSYIAKYSPEGELMWSKKIGGQNTQIITDLALDYNNSIYATGNFSYECLVGSNIQAIQQSKYEYKSGNSLFYLHILEDGELDFAQFEDNKGYNSHVSGISIAVDEIGKTHILGNFNDTLLIAGKNIGTWHPNQNGFYSIWDGNKLVELERIGGAKSWLFANKMYYNKSYFAAAGIYYGDSAYLLIKGKKVYLSNNDYGKAVYIYGGKNETSETKTAKDSLIAKIQSVKLERIERIETLLACTKYQVEPPKDNWLPINAGFKSPAQNKLNPCGEIVKGMELTLFPNPTSETLNLKLVGIEGKVQIEIYSMSGSLILTQKLEEIFESQIISFNVQQLSAGTYFIRVAQNNLEKSIKFIKIN